MDDPFDLARFVAAQAGRGAGAPYATALAELLAGAKHGHWMWYIFPQIVGLGHSAVAQRYAIRSRAEARAYLDHPLLGPRLAACIAALQALPADHSAEDVFGPVDALKLRSSLTLFVAAGGGAPLADALARWCVAPDQSTLDRLAALDRAS